VCSSDLSHLKKPANIDLGINYFCFRHKQAPKWESFPHGGCWTVRLDPKNHTHVNQQWELLVFSLLGELLPEAVVGVVCSQRKQGCLLSVWHQACSQDERFHIGERFRDALQMPLEVVLQYKSFDDTIRDGHSHRNAIGYVYVPSGSAQEQAHGGHDYDHDHDDDHDHDHEQHQQQQQQQHQQQHHPAPKSPKGNRNQSRQSQQQQQQQQQPHNQHHLQQRPRQKSISS